MRSILTLSALIMVFGACGGQRVEERHDPGLITLEGELQNRFVLATEQDEIIGRLRIGSGTIGQRRRPPIDLALVIDSSGSMEGQPMEDARNAAVSIVDALSEGDRLAVVVFHSVAEVLVSATEVDRDNVVEIREKIAAMRAQGTTEMAGGLAAALAELNRTQNPNAIQRIVLLGDGIPNDPMPIAALAQTAGSRGVSITALGLGLEYDEILMGSIAQLSGGQFHYVEDSARVAGLFREEVLRMQQVVARNVVATIIPGPGVQIHEVVGQQVAAANRGVRVSLGDISEGEHTDLIVHALVQGRRAGSAVELFDVKLDFVDAVDDAGPWERRVYLGARATDDREEHARGHNREVERDAARARTAAVTVEAIAAVRDGRQDAAQALLLNAERQAVRAEDEEQLGNIRSLQDDIQAGSGTAEGAPSRVSRVAHEAAMNRLFH